MRRMILSVCVLAAACSGQGPSSLTAPTAVTIAGGSIQAQSGQTREQRGAEVPFSGTFAGQTHATFVPPITLVITGTESGTATFLGRFTAASEDHVNVTNNTGTGTYVFTAANGDQLRVETSGAETEFIPPNVSKVTLTATITGGTGRFADAAGTFTIHQTDTIDEATSSAWRSGSFDGFISLKE